MDGEGRLKKILLYSTFFPGGRLKNASSSVRDAASLRQERREGGFKRSADLSKKGIHRSEVKASAGRALDGKERALVEGEQSEEGRCACRWSKRRKVSNSSASSDQCTCPVAFLRATKHRHRVRRG